MSAEDSDCSIEVSDFEDDDDDGASVVLTSAEHDSSDDSEEDSCGFFSDEDQLDENWNHQEVKKGRRQFHCSNDKVNQDSDWIIQGKCALCRNLERVSEDELEERCQSSSVETWCKCGCCKIVSYHMKKYDRICCHELSGILDFIQSDSSDSDHEGQQYQGHRTNEHGDAHVGCITLHPKFTSDVLEYGALYRVHSSDQSDQPGSNVKFRKSREERERAHSANCSFIRWIWSRLGYGHRVMPPACVIAKIREVHMTSAPFWYYQNFIPGKFRCEFGKHCVAAAKDTINIK